MLSVHHDLNDDLALMANLGWQNWSEFGETGVSPGGPNATRLDVDSDFSDTWHLCAGCALPARRAMVGIGRVCL